MIKLGLWLGVVFNTLSGLCWMLLAYYYLWPIAVSFAAATYFVMALFCWQILQLYNRAVEKRKINERK